MYLLRLELLRDFLPCSLGPVVCVVYDNLTAAIASFRAAKALATNPGSREAIGSFRWRNSEPFQWKAQQLMDLGLMEPGQWF